MSSPAKDEKSSTAYLLVTHGSRDPRSEQGAQALVHHLQTSSGSGNAHPPLDSDLSSPSRPSPSLQSTSLQSPSLQSTSKSEGQLAILRPQNQSTALQIGTAVLELGPTALHQQIQDFVHHCKLSAGSCLKILPLFLLPGVHVMEDIPAEVEQAKRALAEDARYQGVEIDVLPYLGSQHQAMATLLGSTSVLTTSSSSKTFQILMAHGSRRTGASEHIQALGDRLGLPVAYWVKPKSLSQQIQSVVQQQLAEQGQNNTAIQPEKNVPGQPGQANPIPGTGTNRATHLTIEVLPYFLFEGGLTDAIAQRLQELEHQLRAQCPHLNLRLGKPLSEYPGFPALVQAQLGPTNEQN